MDAQDLAAPLVVVLPEVLDLTTVGSMREKLHSAFTSGADVVIADMTSTAYCDTMCCRTLLSAQDIAQVWGIELRVAVRPGAVWRVLSVLGIDRRIPVYPSLDAAKVSEPAAV